MKKRGMTRISLSEAPMKSPAVTDPFHFCRNISAERAL